LTEKKYSRQIDELQDHFKKYPSLSLATKLGRKIYKEILSGNIPSCSISGNWFRGRAVSSAKVYENKDMYVPPSGKTGGGRYHHAGQSVLYIADSRQTAIAEVLEDYFQAALVWIQEYDINGVDKILDLRSDWDRIGMTNSTILVAIYQGD
jgi:hypothetical protein